MEPDHELVALVESLAAGNASRPALVSPGW